MSQIYQHTDEDSGRIIVRRAEGGYLFTSTTPEGAAPVDVPAVEVPDVDARRLVYGLAADLGLVVGEAPTPPVATISELADVLAKEIEDDNEAHERDLVALLRVAAEAYPLAVPGNQSPLDRLALAVARFAESGLAAWRKAEADEEAEIA